MPARLRFLTPIRQPAVETAFGFCLLLTILIAHLSLLFTGQLGLIPSLSILGFFAGSLFYQARLRALPRNFWTGSLIVSLGLSLLIAFFGGLDFESIYDGITSFLVLALIIRYFTRETERDELLLIILSLLEVAAATVITVSISFLFMLIAFMVMISSALMLFVIRFELRALGRGEKASEISDEVSRPRGEGWQERLIISISEGRSSNARIPLHFFRLPSVAVVALLLLGFTFFFVIPRVGRGLFSWKTGERARVTGFSNRVDLGSVGEVKESKSLVMRVKIEDGDPGEGPLYFRGNALDYYDGSGWSDSLGARKSHYFRFQNPVYFPEAGAGGEAVTQEVVLEPIESNVLFGLPWMRSVVVPFKFRALLEYENDYAGLPSDGPIYERVVYTVESSSSLMVAELCSEREVTSNEMIGYRVSEAYLELPVGGEEIQKLADQVVGDEAGFCGRIIRVRDYLHDHYSYDLNPPAGSGEDPILNFLFNTRRGYCEHFATAMALMLRSQGIPCRIGAGYLSDDYNAIEGFYMVRESDAHTWVEIYVPGRGWAMIDPTPPSREHRDANPFWKRVSDLMDAVQYRWDRYVVDLSLQEQFGLLMKAREQSAAMGTRLHGLRRGLTSALTGRAAYFLALVVALSAIAYWLWSRNEVRRLRGMGPRRRMMTQVMIEYRALLKLLTRIGLKRKESETLSEFAVRVAMEFPALAAAFSEATALYQEVRFGGKPSGERARQAIRSSLMALRRTHRPSRAGPGSRP